MLTVSEDGQPIALGIVVEQRRGFALGLKHVRLHAPKAQIVAEKVETAEQHERMSQLGVKLFQGYWFAKPSIVNGDRMRVL